MPIFSANCESCGDGFDPQSHEVTRCLLCLTLPFEADAIYSLWTLEGRAESAIKLYKYAAHELLATFFANRLAEKHSSLNAGLVIPLPSSLTTLKSRGFNHTCAIAKRFARELSLPFSATALRPSRNRNFQASLAIEERYKNVAGAFTAVQSRVHGKRIILIDDIITTGASVGEACRELRRVGASSIVVLSLARSKRFNRYRLERGLHIIKSSIKWDGFERLDTGINRV